MLLLPLLLAGCNANGTIDATGDTSTATGTATGTNPTSSTTTGSTGPVCDAVFASVTPEDGATGVPVDTDLVIGFTGTVLAEADVDFSITPDVPFTVNLGTDAVTISFDAPLDYHTTYDWEVALCGGYIESGSFTTEIEVTGNPEDVSGVTWAADLLYATWTEPAGLQSLLGGYYPYVYLLLHAQSADASTIDLIATGGIEGKAGIEQDPCSITTDLPPTDFTGYPAFNAGPVDSSLHIVVEDYNIVVDTPLRNLQVEGMLTADAWVDGTLSGQIDARDQSGLSPDDFCYYVTFAGLSCTPCASDGASYCLDVLIEDIQGEAVPGLTIEPVTKAPPYCP